MFNVSTNMQIQANALKNARWSLVDIALIVLVIFSFAIILGFLLLSRPHSTIASQGDPLLQPTDNPLQSSVTGEAANPIIWEENGITWTMQPRASYQIAAHVLGNKRYYDWQSGMVPRDLALAWGGISDPSVDRWIHWRQSGRWYYYEWDSGDYGRSYITGHSANAHIISATDNLDKALRRVEKDDAIYLEGYLVNLQVRDDGRVDRVSTSLSREDTGTGACEILYVVRLILDGQLYE